jgi:hypothetical protein
MRRLLIATAAAAALLMSGSLAGSQAPSQSPVAPQSKVNLTLEQRHVIKEIVKDLNVQKAPADTPVSIGATVPQTVPLNPMPADISQKVPQVRSHTFFVAGDRIILVSPNDKTIAEVIE